MEYKDYYRVLGVARNASREQIQKAFRRLARCCHPDVAAQAASAEREFQELNEAYAVLSDPLRRAKYDRLSSHVSHGPATPSGMPPSMPPAAPNHGPSPSERESQPRVRLRGTGFSDFYEDHFRPKRVTEEEPVTANNPAAGPEERGRDMEAQIMVGLDESIQGGVRPILLQRSSPCPRCGDQGVWNGDSCPECEGRGHTCRVETYHLKIPAGIGEGDSLRLQARGEPGRNGGAAGDLYLRVRLVIPPPYEVTEEGALSYELSLAPWEAVLGVELALDGLGEEIELQIGPGTQHGDILRLQGRGLRRNGIQGDLLVRVNVRLPRELNGRERALWEQLRRESCFEARAEE